MTREEALAILKDRRRRVLVFYLDDALEEATGLAIEAIEALHERKTGQWIPDQFCIHKPSRIRNTDRWTIYHCSCCGYSNGRRFNDRFCPHCGARMEVEE